MYVIVLFKTHGLPTRNEDFVEMPVNKPFVCFGNLQFIVINNCDQRSS